MMRSSQSLFPDSSSSSDRVQLADGAVLLRGFASGDAPALVQAVEKISSAAPFRNLVTPGGHRMSVAMTNCGQAGWVSDRTGYRYDPRDPETGEPWPAMPDTFLNLAQRATAAAGFASFTPDVCLINRYEPGTRLSLHQDRDEHDYRQPIISVSLGIPAVFLFGGAERSERPRRILVENGDIAVWGGPARLFFHGVAPLKPGFHPLLGNCRINLTFRKAL
jgi:alkylated DNA repair protein (DNA oxidative demethylase)